MIILIPLIGRSDFFEFYASQSNWDFDYLFEEPTGVWKNTDSCFIPWE